MEGRQLTDAWGRPIDLWVKMVLSKMKQSLIMMQFVQH